MFERALAMYIYAETPIHPGTGSSINGIVDLPIQRERHTDFPMIQGSTLKGILRHAPKGAGEKGPSFTEMCKDCPKYENGKAIEACEVCGKIFGSENEVGGISVTDARIIAFPVRMLKGVFGWITCPLVLERYRRDLKLVGINEADGWKIPRPSVNEAIITGNADFADKDGYIYIEDLQLKANKNLENNLEIIANHVSEALPDNSTYKETREKIKKDLIVVSDDLFRDLALFTTEVVARTRINPATGTVESGALWWEENLPSDTLMYSLILIPSRAKEIDVSKLKIGLRERIANNGMETDRALVTILKEAYNEKVLQVGGDETIGKGFAMIKMEGGDE